MYDTARTNVKFVWRNEAFYNKNWCSPGVDIESLFIEDIRACRLDRDILRERGGWKKRI